MQVAEVPCAGRVDGLGAQPLACLPEPERHTGRIGADRRPAHLPDVGRSDKHPPAGRFDPRGRGVGVGDRDVGVPRRWPDRATGGRGSSAYAGGIKAIELGDDIPRGSAGRRRVRERPSEQPAVESLGGLDVSVLDVDPRRHPLGVGPCLAHLSSLEHRPFRSPPAAMCRTWQRGITPPARRGRRTAPVPQMTLCGFPLHAAESLIGFLTPPA